MPSKRASVVQPKDGILTLLHVFRGDVRGVRDGALGSADHGACGDKTAVEMKVAGQCGEGNGMNGKVALR